MSKRKRTPDNQLDLLDLIQAAESLAQRSDSDHGANSDLERRIGKSMAAYFRQSGAMGRGAVAGLISDDLDRDVSKDMLDKFTSEAAPHRIPVDVVTSFVKVTGWRQPQEIQARAAGLFVMPGMEALRAEIQKYDEAERRARKEKRRRMAFLTEMEGDQ